MRGKAVDKLARTTNQIDEGTKEQRKVQFFTSDIMYVMGGKYLISVAEPLELTVTVAVKSRSEEHLGQTVTSQIKILDSRGFSVNRIITNPEKGLLALRGKIPGVNIDPVGAGDHLNKVDARIRRLKEIMRCVIAEFP